MDWLKCSEVVLLEFDYADKKDDWASSATFVLADVSYTIELGVFGDCMKSKVSMTDSMKSSLWNIKLQQTATFNVYEEKKKIEKIESLFQLEMDRYCHETILATVEPVQSELNNSEVKDTVDTFSFEFKVVDSFGVGNLASSVLADQLNSTSDMTLIVEDKEVRVNKGFLSTLSRYFCSLFNGNFTEKDEGKIELKDIYHDEMADFLMIIHGIHNNVNANNYVHLLKLADLFQVAFIKRMCEEYMLTLRSYYVNGNYSERLAALCLSEKYQLPRIQQIVVSSMDTLTDLKAIVKHKEFLDLSSNGKAFVLEHSITSLQHLSKCNCGRFFEKSYCSCGACTLHTISK